MALFDVPIYEIGPEKMNDTFAASSSAICLSILRREILNPLDSVSFSISAGGRKLKLKSILLKLFHSQHP